MGVLYFCSPQKNSLPPPAPKAHWIRGEAGLLRIAVRRFVGCREASSSLVARSKKGRHDISHAFLFWRSAGRGSNRARAKRENASVGRKAPACTVTALRFPCPMGPPIAPFPRKHLTLSATGGASVLSVSRCGSTASEPRRSPVPAQGRAPPALRGIASLAAQGQSSALI